MRFIYYWGRWRFMADYDVHDIGLGIHLHVSHEGKGFNPNILVHILPFKIMFGRLTDSQVQIAEQLYKYGDRVKSVNVTLEDDDESS